MIDYKKLDSIYTTQWPFNHWKLDPSKYINEVEAEDYFESKKYFQVVYFNNNARIFCIDFEINHVVLTLYRDGGPMYQYGFKMIEGSYCKLMLRSIREKNIECSIHEDGNAYIVERSSLLGKDKTYKKSMTIMFAGLFI